MGRDRDKRESVWGLRRGGRRPGGLSVGAVLVGGGDVGAVRLLAVFAWRHPLIYPVQAARFLEVTDLPRGREALNG